MGISLKPEHLKRYKELAALLIKHGRSDLVRQIGLDPALEPSTMDPAEVPPQAIELADDLERLGPTYIKLGQLLSTRGDILPIAYMTALARLQDKVAPFPFEDVERIVTTELGVRISRAFSDFEQTPMAAASLGQVHRARLRDGRLVAVKVQRPDIREQVVQDLEVLDDVAQFLDSHTEAGKLYQFTKILDEFRRSLMRELDYRQEARNLATLGENLRGFEHMVVPSPVQDYSSERVLTMDYIRGTKVTSLSPLARVELSGEALAEELFRAYLQQILVDGFFHADPHPGNVFITDDGRIALLDLGMVARLSGDLQDKLIKMILAMSEGRGEEVASLGLQLGEKTEHFDEGEFRRRVADLVVRHQGASMAQIEVGALVLEEARISADCGIRLPAEFTMLGKTLLNLDHVARTLDPDFNPNAAIQRNASDILRQRVLKDFTPSNMMRGLIETKEFVQQLPGRTNRILDLLASNDLRVKVDAIDEAVLISGLQKIANRITLGLILAALIVGASLLMQVDTPFRILGYPGLAIVCFLLAAGGGLALVVTILASDVRAPR